MIVYISMSHFSISRLINNLTFSLTLFSISSPCNSIEPPSSGELIFGGYCDNADLHWLLGLEVIFICLMVDALTMIPLLFAAIPSYPTGTPVFTPGGYWYLGWVFAMWYFLCKNGIEHNIMVRRNIWYVCSLHISLPHVKILNSCEKLMYVCWTCVDNISWSKIFGSMAVLLNILCYDAT